MLMMRGALGSDGSHDVRCLEPDRSQDYARLQLNPADADDAQCFGKSDRGSKLIQLMLMMRGAWDKIGRSMMGGTAWDQIGE